MTPSKVKLGRRGLLALTAAAFIGGFGVAMADDLQVIW